MKRRALGLLLFCAASGCRTCIDVEPEQTEAERGLDWLLAQQREDGSFRSETYGLMKSGQSMTPFVARLLDLCGSGRAVGRANEWIEENRGKDGSLGLAGDVADYPLYATALAGTEPNSASYRWLASCQFLKPGHPEHGGFAFSARSAEVGAGPHVCEITRAAWAADALGEFPGAAAAIDWVSRCQAPDGGFYFNTVRDAHKAGVEVSYGSATCDGIRALLRFGVPRSDPRIQKALRWLTNHASFSKVPGFDGKPPHWEDALFYYYAAGLARVYDELGGPEGWREALAGEVKRRQNADGSWSNPNGAMREDDPLIATTLALEALFRCRE